MTQTDKKIFLIIKKLSGEVGSSENSKSSLSFSKLNIYQVSKVAFI